MGYDAVKSGSNIFRTNVVSDTEYTAVVALCKGEVQVLCEAGSELLLHLGERQASCSNNITKRNQNL
jgi:hypothetical protein